MKVGVLGGTFDPPHIAHLVLAERAREQLRLERVLWIPAGSPWRKNERSITAPELRVEMVQLAIEENDAFEVSRLEVDRAGPSYSVDTLEQLRAQDPDDELFFILGADALEDLPNWHRPERLLALATLAVAPRDEERPALPEGLHGRVVWIDMPRLDVGATDLRRRAAAGRSLAYLVPDAVAAYVREHGLYRT